MRWVSAEFLFNELKPFTGCELSDEDVENVWGICERYNCRPDFAYHGGRGSASDCAVLRGVRFPTLIEVWDDDSERLIERPGTEYGFASLEDDWKDFVPGTGKSPEWKRILLDYEWMNV